MSQQTPLLPENEWQSQPHYEQPPLLPESEWQSQPYYEQPPQYQPPMPPPPMAPKKPKSRKRLWLFIGLVVLVLFVIGSIVAQAVNTNQPTTTQATKPTSTVQQPTAQPPTPTSQSQPTPTVVPTQTQAKIEADYKASTTSTTVANLDKNGTADQGKDVHFISKILGFVKDSTGNTAGANVTTPDSYAGTIQVIFTPGTDITQLNQGDILEVWGTDGGVFSGTNAFGGTVQEVGIAAVYMFDQTTNYQANT